LALLLGYDRVENLIEAIHKAEKEKTVLVDLLALELTSWRDSLKHIGLVLIKVFSQVEICCESRLTN